MWSRPSQARLEIRPTNTDVAGGLIIRFDPKPADALCDARVR